MKLSRTNVHTTPVCCAALCGVGWARNHSYFCGSVCSHGFRDVQLSQHGGLWQGWPSHHLLHDGETEQAVCLRSRCHFWLGVECLSLNTCLGLRHCVNLVQSLASLFDLITFLNYRFLFTNIICMCIMCVSDVYQKKSRILWVWWYRELWAALWVLGTTPGSCRRPARALTTECFLHPNCCDL
jgi:hypothetical protein